MREARSRLLPELLELHDVPDVENMCHGIVRELERAKTAGRAAGEGQPLDLSPEDYDDAVSYLIGEAWVLSERWQPDRGVPFRLYAYGTLRLRLVDHVRARFGRRGQFRPPGGSTFELDTRGVVGSASGDTGADATFGRGASAASGVRPVGLPRARVDTLADAESARPGDREADSFAALAGELGVGGSDEARDVAELGLPRPRRPARRARGARRNGSGQ